MRTLIRVVSAAAVCAASILMGTQAHADIATTPLVTSSKEASSLMLSLSIEFPTTGRAYNPSSSSSDAKYRSYTPGVIYLGYFDHKQCYTYNTTLRAFVPQTAADNNLECNGYFSGNFMNYVSMSSIDILRLALTGGWRVRDDDPSTGQITVVSRAFLRDDYYGSGSNFPRESFTPAVIKRVTPYNVNQNVYVTSCRDRIFFSVNNGGNCDSPNAELSVKHTNADPQFGYFVRVQMCTNDLERARTPSDERSRACYKYTSKTGVDIWKPIGLFQKYGDSIRIGIGAYINDDSTARYGGMIRVPLKNVTNEFSGSTGVYITNPDSATEGNSGAINFLNKFGLSDASLNPYVFTSAQWNKQSAIYKTYDTMGELYYEVVQYLRGKQPDPAAYVGLTSSMKNGFPALTSWTDPFSSSTCPSAYVINVSDTNTWCDSNLPGNKRTDLGCGDLPRSVQAGEVDVYAQTKLLGNKLNALSSKLTNRSTLADELTGVGNASFYSAGLAYWARENDVRPDIAGDQRITTFSFDVNEPSGLAVQDRQLYLMGLGGGTRELDANKDPLSYILAASPFVLFNQLESVFSKIAASSGTQSVVAVGGARITSNTLLYQPIYRSQTWLGDLRAYNAVTGERVWSAASFLTSEVDRQIITFNNTSRLGVAFNWALLSPPSDTNSQQTALNTNENNVADGRGQDRLAWLRGSAALEGTTGTSFRTRNDSELGATRLGDIVNSSPWVAGPPTAGYLDKNYASFAKTNSGRRAMVYVGANDGMLHAFDANSGKELLAYVPSQVFPSLSKLTSLNYQKQAYVDGSPMVGDVQVKTSTGTQWKSVLLGALGAGGKSIFALDVTNPGASNTTSTGSFNESNASSLALWEFSSADDPDLGYVIGTPTPISSTLQPLQYVKVNVNSTPRWAAAVGNGYFSTGGTNGASRPVLFLIFLDRVGSSKLVKNTDYIELVATNTTYADCPNNGLAYPTPVDANGDGFVDFLYAGDACGNIWRFNVSPDSKAIGVTTNPSTWGIGHSNGPLFTAVVNNKRQPITSVPIVLPNRQANVGYLVLFGTGKLFEPSDRASTDVQSVYGIWDEDGVKTVSASQLSSPSFTNSGAPVSGTGTAAGNSYRVLGVNCVRYVSSQTCSSTNPGGVTPALKRGWTVRLPASGERSVSNASIAISGKEAGVIVTTIVPPADLACGASFSSWINLIDAYSGGASQTFFFDTTGASSPNFANGASSFQNLDNGFGIGVTTSTADGVTGSTDNKKGLNFSGSPKSELLWCNKQRINSGASGKVSGFDLPSCGNMGRQNWREFIRP